VAVRAGWVGAVFLDQLPLGEALRRFLREYGNALRRARQFFPKDHLTQPVAAQNGAGAGRAALFRQGASKAKNTAPPLGAETVHAAPFRPPWLEAVVGCKLSV
jgi:hypothetical protein